MKFTTILKISIPFLIVGAFIGVLFLFRPYPVTVDISGKGLLLTRNNVSSDFNADYDDMEKADISVKVEISRHVFDVKDVSGTIKINDREYEINHVDVEDDGRYYLNSIDYSRGGIAHKMLCILSSDLSAINIWAYDGDNSECYICPAENKEQAIQNNNKVWFPDHEYQSE